MPVYLRYLGAETFGLIGFFTMLQTWLLLLDFGLTPTLSRQMACYRAGILSIQELRTLLRTLECFFGLLALLTTLAGISASSWVAIKWLKLDHLQPGMVAVCISMMAAVSGLRWISGLYRSGLIGLEYQTLTNAIMAGIATLKFVGVFPVLIFVSAEPIAFFGYQVVVASFEAFIYWKFLHDRVGGTTIRTKPSLRILKDVLPFAGSLAFTTAIGILNMNLDKLLLSHFQPLREYGYFSIALAIASGILMLIAPMTQVTQPRLTILLSQGKNTEFLGLFHEVSQFVSGLMAAVSINVAFFAIPLLLAWTGDFEVSTHAAPILVWYALGNGIIGVLTMPYLIQYASGNLRLHVIGNIIFGSALLPSIVYAAWKYGGIGTGIVWFATNLVALLLWVPIVFRIYLKGMFLNWLIKDVLYLWISASIPIIFFSLFQSNFDSKPLILVQLLFVGCLSLLFAWLAGDKTRAHILNFVHRRNI